MVLNKPLFTGCMKDNRPIDKKLETLLRDYGVIGREDEEAELRLMFKDILGPDEELFRFFLRKVRGEDPDINEFVNGHNPADDTSSTLYNPSKHKNCRTKRPSSLYKKRPDPKYVQGLDPKVDYTAAKNAFDYITKNYPKIKKPGEDVLDHIPQIMTGDIAFYETDNIDKRAQEVLDKKNIIT